MTVFVLSILAVAVVATVAVVVLRGRNDSYRRTQRSLAQALDTEPTDADLLRAARDSVQASAESRKLANGYAAALQGAIVGIAILSDSGTVEYANPAAHLVLDVLVVANVFRKSRIPTPHHQPRLQPCPDHLGLHKIHV